MPPRRAQSQPTTITIPLFIERLLLICSGILIVFALKYQFVGLGEQAAASVRAVSEAEAKTEHALYGENGGWGGDHELVSFSDHEEYEALQAGATPTTDDRLDAVNDALEKARKAGELASEEVEEDLWDVHPDAHHLGADPHFLF